MVKTGSRKVDISIALLISTRLGKFSRFYRCDYFVIFFNYMLLIGGGVLVPTALGSVN